MKSYIRNCSTVAATLLLAASTAFCQRDQCLGPSSGWPFDVQLSFGNDAPDPQDVGKNLVVGQLKTVEPMKLTVSRPDGVEQSVVVDVNTKYLGDHGNVVTLAAFRTGEPVAAIGTLENGEFVATKVLKVPSCPRTPAPAVPNWSAA